MAAVPVTFQGILFFSDVGVGGGPMPGGPPLGIWPSPGVPTHPIAPGGQPPGITTNIGKLSYELGYYFKYNTCLLGCFGFRFTYTPIS